MGLFKRKHTFLLALLLSLSFILTGCDSTTKKEEPKTKEEIAENVLTVGTFNIDVKAPDTDVNDQRKLLSDKGVEVFGIQEVDYHLPRHGKDMYDPFSDFQKDIYTDSFFGESIKKGTGGYGNGVVSKYKIIESEVVPLVGPEQIDPALMQEFIDIYGRYDPNSEESKGELMKVWGPDGLVAQGAIEPRSYTRVVFEKDGKKIAFYSTHLSVESFEIRTQQLQQLKTALDTDSVEYKILVGDFNTDQGINEFNIFTDNYDLANGYEGVWRETMKEKDSARDSLDTSMRVKFLDNIIVSKNLKVRNVEVVKTDLSDHYPLIVELILE